jgi:hypothetical protein
MRISDEAVRVIENRVLDALRHGLALEANGQPITVMRLAKAFRQPAASQIGAGRDTRLTAGASTAHRGELRIVPSSFSPEPGRAHRPRGAIVGRA